MSADPRPEVERFYDEAARDWDETHASRQNPVFRRQLRASLEGLLAPARGAPLAIEVGAGTGPYLDLVAPMFQRLVCTDLSAGMLAVLEARRAALGLGNVEARKDDAGLLEGFDDGCADAVFCVGLLETLPAPDRMFRAVRRVLRPGGILAGVTSNGDCPWYRVRRRVEGGDRPGHIVRFVRGADLRALAARTGFEVSLLDTWGLVPPGMSSGATATFLHAAGRVIHATPARRFLGVLSFRLVAA